jgi:hypothetical protein
MLFTLAIIPQELRTQPWAWRALGYLNNLHFAPSSEISTRLRGQHICNTQLFTSSSQFLLVIYGEKVFIYIQIYTKNEQFCNRCLLVVHFC